MDILYDSSWHELPLYDATLNSVTKLKIQEFTNLDSDWCYGSGVKFSQSVIDDAIKILGLVNTYGFYETDAFPGADGEVMITAYRDKFYFEILIYEDKKYDFIVEINDDETSRNEGINFNAVIASLKQFRETVVCNSSELFTQSISIKQNKDIPVWRLGIQATTGEYQLSKKIASFRLLDPYVNISKNIMEKYQENQSYFGNSAQVYYPQHTQ